MSKYSAFQWEDKGAPFSYALLMICQYPYGEQIL